MKSLCKTLIIVSLLGFSYFTFANDNPINSQWQWICGMDQYGKNICLDQKAHLVSAESLQKSIPQPIQKSQ